MSIIADVVDGKVDISESSQSKERKVGSQLGKDDFLLLLVTQMKYQDPLQPTDNTEYVTQLAQFSELEYMQNMMDVTQHTSAFTLVGKYVYAESTSSSGHNQKEEGMVEFVTMKDGDAYVTVNGVEFKYDEIVEVRDEYFVISQKLPSVKEQQILFLHHDPQNVVIDGVSLGEDEYQASSMGIGIINEKGETVTVDPKNVVYSDGKLTIDKKVFEKFGAGTYNIAFVFDDPNKTVDYENVTLVIKGVKPDLPPGTDTENPDGTEGDGETEGDGSTEGTEGTEKPGGTEGDGNTEGSGSTENPGETGTEGAGTATA